MEIKDIYEMNLPSRAILVYENLNFRAGSKRKCWPSVRCIANDTGLSTRTVRRAIDDLRNAGLIITYHRIRKSGAWSSLLYELV